MQVYQKLAHWLSGSYIEAKLKIRVFSSLYPSPDNEKLESSLDPTMVPVRTGKPNRNHGMRRNHGTERKSEPDQAIGSPVPNRTETRS